MRQPTFMPFLFDSKEAWEKSIIDSRYSYNMSFNDFMIIYQEYRTGKVTIKSVKEPKQIEVKKETYSEILDQSEIDKLIEEFMSK